MNNSKVTTNNAKYIRWQQEAKVGYQLSGNDNSDSKQQNKTCIPNKILDKPQQQIEPFWKNNMNNFKHQD